MNVTKREGRRIGETIRVLRETRGFTQDEFARELRISRPYLSLIESGKKTVTERLVALAADVLGVRQIAIVREGYFEVELEKAEREAAVKAAEKRLTALRAEAQSLAEQVERARADLDTLTNQFKKAVA